MMGWLGEGVTATGYGVSFRGNETSEIFRDGCTLTIANTANLCTLKMNFIACEL